MVDNTLANREIVVYALYLLGGATKRCHTEDVAIKCYQIQPTSFSWSKYTEYPDKDIVRVALTDARKERYGALVDGRSGQKRGQYKKASRKPAVDGWILTESGVQWVESNLDQLSGIGEVTKDHRQKTLQFLKRVKKHKVFDQYTDDPTHYSPSIGDLADLLRCRVDASESIWLDRFDRIKRNAVAAGETIYIDFIEKSIAAYATQR
jgi:hypothetical protein